MNCPRCRTANPPQAKFCLECAAPLAVRCSNCGTQLAPNAKFCFECAEPVSSAAPPAASRFSSPDAYTPKHLAERILTSKSALEGERKQVTVLFADLKGSMELLADRDPEEARKILDPVLERMMEAVHRYEGTVNQVMGDGIMALFGAPLALEDHSLRACYAALRMEESIKRYAEELRRRHGALVQVRVGLNSGEVVVRSISNDLHMDYTAVGQTTHLAARMEQLAMPGSILMSGATLRLAEGYVEVRPLGPVNVKGLSEAVEAFELTGASAARTRIQALSRRGLSRFVGRDAEMDALGRALREATEGHGQVVAVVGEPGVGKSRLVHEFVHSHWMKSCLPLESASVSYGKATSYLPVIDLLKRYFGIADRDDERAIREKVTGKLLTLDRGLEPFLPPLLALLDVDVGDREWQALDPPRRRQRTLDTLKRLFVRESQMQPLVLVFEDLHWIDTETQALLDSLVDSLPAARMFLLVNYRPEYQHRWASKTYYRQLRLDPLPPASTEELVNALLGMVPEMTPLKRLLMNRTEGNPFFLEESVRVLEETGALVGERGAYHLAVSVIEINTPATVQAVLRARIDRLTLDHKRLLETAAVIGKDVPFALLQAVSDLPEEALGAALGALRASEFLYETRLFPDLEYTFKHALTHEVAYGSLLHERRRALHGAIVDAVERLYADRPAEHIERLAHHALLAEAWEKARRYVQQAGDKALARSANREAAAWFEQALAVLEHLPETKENLTLAVDIRIDLRNALHRLGEPERTLEPLRQAAAVAERLGDHGRLGRVEANLASYFDTVGEYERALVCAQRALALAPSDDLSARAVAHLALGLAHWYRGDYLQAIEFEKRTVEMLRGPLVSQRLGGVGFPALLARANLAVNLAELGRFTAAIAYGDEADPMRPTADAYSQIFVDFSVAYVHLRKGTLDQAVRLLERALAACSATDIRNLFHIVASRLGLAYALLGDAGRAIPLAEQALEAAVTPGMVAMRSWTQTALGEVYLIAGHTTDARKQSGLALDLSVERKERGWEAWARRLLGEIYSREGGADVQKAQVFYGHANALATELGMRPLVAHCHLGLGKLYRRTGKREQAQEHFTTATTMYREMGMTYWLEQAERETKEST